DFLTLKNLPSPKTKGVWGESPRRQQRPGDLPRKQGSGAPPGNNNLAKSAYKTNFLVDLLVLSAIINLSAPTGIK
ncbi:MAG: hypothetical protein IJR93_08285, partial [Treponema sp.]|nr:hypothetical protein [Treponema sp.]